MPTKAALSTRRAGVLLHVSALPGDGACGRFNVDAMRFVDFLSDAGCTVWQMLPLGPTQADRSPYQSPSSFALNPDFLDTDWPIDSTTSLDAFILQHAHWLHDYALYRVLKQRFDQRSWVDWPDPIKYREPQALAQSAEREAESMQQIFREQHTLFGAWGRIRAHARARGVQLFGDLPIFVSHDSADVWAHPTLFELDDQGQPMTVAGVPPDYFSSTGQRWGNPHYRWEVMAQDRFGWWRRRMAHHLALFDWVRIDHFRGLEACWIIPATDSTAVHGHWRKSPGADLLHAFADEFQTLPIVAEDLGIITPEVDALRQQFGLPGMKILQFAFDGGPDNPYLPHQHTRHSVVYTGTHDNDTTLGWFRRLDQPRQAQVLDYLSQPSEPMPWPLIRSALASVAETAIIPMQDLLELDSAHRTNTPGTCTGNWIWRFQWPDLPGTLTTRVRHLVHLYGRSGDSSLN
jgi:4-alpha-glucanotransferase